MHRVRIERAAENPSRESPSRGKAESRTRFANLRPILARPEW
jgi:hypothetical protein